MRRLLDFFRRLSPTTVVVAAFALLIALTLFAGVVFRHVPSPREACATDCAKKKLHGRLVYTGPATVKDTTLSSECRCE